MPNAKSYTITLSNNKTESDARQLLVRQNSNFMLPSRDEKKHILNVLKLSKSFNRAFDLIYVPNRDISKNDETIIDKNKFILIELKTTRKCLKNNPYGFFFGATQNEFELARKMGERYKFCFISLHTKSSSYAMVTLEELNTMIKTKRIQYQINMKVRPD